MIRVDVESTFEPIIGSEVQSKELIDYLMKDHDQNPNEIWKISLMPDNIRFKLQTTLSKVVNKGSSNMIAIVI